MDFFEQLKRRKVVRVLVGYGVAGVGLFVNPTKMVELYRALDVLAVGGAIVCAVIWWRRAEPMVVPVAVMLLIVITAAIGAIVHGSNYSQIGVWPVQSAVYAFVLMLATGLHLKGVFNGRS